MAVAAARRETNAITMDKVKGRIGIAIGVVGIIVAAIATYVAFAGSDWTRRNDLYCYQLTYGYTCAYTRRDCENSQQKEDKSAITKGCTKEVLRPN